MWFKKLGDIKTNVSTTRTGNNIKNSNINLTNEDNIDFEIYKTIGVLSAHVENLKQDIEVIQKAIGEMYREITKIKTKLQIHLKGGVR